ncbi:MAG: head-tail connector protein [Alphaproteobacteria bacterium]|nr:head-tail connector protein [Alphaproteobacteria bacterium]
MNEQNDPEAQRVVLKRFEKAKERRNVWEGHWQECYDYALPSRGGPLLSSQPGAKRTDRLFDGTAPDCVDQLAASLLAQLTPPWAQWFGLAAGPDLTPEEREVAAPVLEKAGAALQSHFDRSNFAIEMHQCYLDLVTAGTASLLFEEAPLGSASAFRFTAIPLAQLALEESVEGRLDTTFRSSEMTISAIRERFPKAQLPESMDRKSKDAADARFKVVEAVLPERHGYAYHAILDGEGTGGAATLAEGRFDMSPFINFRWLKAPGEVYGRSPVMKSLPDIKTANKVVELVLKNATIAVTGIWQADDDGVLNPANIKLVPGTIIPKAVGSAGLTPLETPGRFDISQLMLTDLRQRISHALLADRLGQIDAPNMTATEVLERSAEMARLLGATYGRLQSELLTPLVMRAVAILKRRGEIPGLSIDGHQIELIYKSPLANERGREDAKNTLQWLTAVMSFGPPANQVVDLGAAARWLAKALNVPAELLRAAPASPGVDPALTSLITGMAQGAVAPQPSDARPVQGGVP